MFEFQVKSNSETDKREWQHAQQLLPQASAIADAPASLSAESSQPAIDLNSAPQSPPLACIQNSSSTASPSLQRLKLKRSAASKTPTPSPSPPAAAKRKAMKLEPDTQHYQSTSESAASGGDSAKDLRGAENAVKNMVASLSQTTSAATEIDNNIKRLKNWSWLSNLPQYEEFRAAILELEEVKQATPLVQQLLVNKCDLGYRHAKLKRSADEPSKTQIAKDHRGASRPVKFPCMHDGAESPSNPRSVGKAPRPPLCAVHACTMDIVHACTIAIVHVCHMAWSIHIP